MANKRCLLGARLETFGNHDDFANPSSFYLLNLEKQKFTPRVSSQSEYIFLD
jgi:hypothetical protein